MSFLKKLTIRTQLLLIIGFMSLLIVGVAGEGLWGLKNVNAGMQTIYNDRVVPLRDLKVVADMYAVNIVDTSHKTRNGNFTWEEGIKNIHEANKRIQDTWKAYTSTFLTAEEKKLVDEAQVMLKDADASIALLLGIMQRQDMAALTDYTINQLYPKIDPISGKISELIDLQLNVARSEYDGAEATYASIRNTQFVILPLVIGLAMFLGFLLIRSISGALEQAYGYFRQMATGDLNVDIRIDRRDEIAKILEAAIEMQGKLTADMAEAQRVAGENLRVRNALDNANSSVMIAGNDGKVVYANNTLVSMLKAASDDIRRELAGFDAEALLGADIDTVLATPAVRRESLRDVTASYRHTCEIGGRTLNLVASPVQNERGERLGVVVEWADLTEQVAAEQQVQHLITAASEGRLDTRLDASRFEGFMQRLAQGINNMMDAIVGPLNVAADCVSSIARGNIPEPISADYKGAFATLRDNLNTCIGAVNALVQDMNALSQAAQAGQLDRRTDASTHQGDFQRIVAGVNGTLDAIVGPLNVAAENISRIARGDVPDAVRERYEGAFATLIDNVNTCSAAVRALVDDTSMLAEAAVNGELSTRAEASRHQGDFRRIVEGVNSAMDAIVVPINETKAVMGALAEGDLSQRVSGESRGDFAVLRDAVNTSTENLQKMVAQIREASASIATSAGEISEGNQDLSARTEQQASSLEETASSMEELTGTVRQNADNARQANQLAASARQLAERGGSVVNNAISAMSEINSASKKISDIIGVIDEIAFQTNLLALNAAVEAARAGEQGRGFAVVASEVRNLAQRSAGAAKEIKDLIKDSGSKVEEGSRLVNETGTSLQDIVGSVKKVSDIIAEIAAASEEQSTGIEQVNKAVTQMDQAVQQNAALVEQAAAASESMLEQGQGLNKLMDSFKGVASVATSAAPARDRRSGPRPWATKASPEPAATPAPKKVVGGDEWQEF